jgi:hypothetical protein
MPERFNLLLVKYPRLSPTRMDEKDVLAAHDLLTLSSQLLISTLKFLPGNLNSQPIPILLSSRLVAKSRLKSGS